MAENPRREAGNNKANEIAVARVNLRSTADASELCGVDGSGLIARATADARDDHADDLDVTAVFPMLVVDDAYGASQEHEEGEQTEDAKTQPTLLEPPSAEERAPSWLQHLESDIQRLQAKWESAAADLRIRVATVQELCRHVEAKDVLVDDLRRQIDEQATARLALETDLKQAAARLTHLVTDQAACDFNVAQARSELQEAWEAIATAEGNRAALDKARLSDAVDRHAETEAGTQAHREDEPKHTSDLRVRIEELETYIDGSKARWSALREKLAEYRDAHRVSERRVADAQARLMAEQMSGDRLWTEAAHLRRSLEKLGAQLAERDTEHRELTRSLKHERTAATQLRGNLASMRARSCQVLAELQAREQRVAQLELLVLARDETIAGLWRRLWARDRAEGELVASKNDLEAHAAALELEVRLAVEAGAQKERDCRNAQQKVTRVEALLREAGHDIDDLVTAIEGKERTILSLEADLRASQDAPGMVERSAGHVDDVDTSVERRRATVDTPPRRH